MTLICVSLGASNTRIYFIRKQKTIREIYTHCIREISEISVTDKFKSLAL